MLQRKGVLLRSVTFSWLSIILVVPSCPSSDSLHVFVWLVFKHRLCWPFTPSCVRLDLTVVDIAKAQRLRVCGVSARVPY
jgi:hypothetical protein